jgi:hypothetical protein
VQLERRDPGRLLRAGDGDGPQRGARSARSRRCRRRCIAAWDLGVGDDTSIWWFADGRRAVLHARSLRGKRRRPGALRRRDRGARAKARLAATATTTCRTTPRSRNGAAANPRRDHGSDGLQPMLVPLSTIDDGINAVRRTLPLCVFHPRCEDGGIARWSSTGANGTTRRSVPRQRGPRLDIASGRQLSLPRPGAAARHPISHPRTDAWQGLIIPPPREPRRGRDYL